MSSVYIACQSVWNGDPVRGNYHNYCDAGSSKEEARTKLDAKITDEIRADLAPQNYKDVVTQELEVPGVVKNLLLKSEFRVWISTFPLMKESYK